MLKTYGIQASFKDDLTIHIPGNQQYTACDYTIEGDYSQLAFFAVLAACNHDLTITGIHHDSRQGDKKILSILKDFGVRIEEVKNGYHIYKSSLHGCKNRSCGLPGSRADPRTVLAMYSPGNTNIYNAGRLRIKESDRIEAMEQELRKFGVDIHSTEDEIFITGNSSYTCTSELSSHNDHRIVMALSVAATCSNISCIIDGAQAIQKSYPRFFERFTVHWWKGGAVMIQENTRFLIVGLGLIGGSYAMGLKKNGYHVLMPLKSTSSALTMQSSITSSIAVQHLILTI